MVKEYNEDIAFVFPQHGRLTIHFISLADTADIFCTYGSLLICPLVLRETLKNRYLSAEIITNLVYRVPLLIDTRTLILKEWNPSSSLT